MPKFSDLQKLVLLFSIGFWSQVFLFWCMGTDYGYSWEIISLSAPFVIGWCWHGVNRMPQWSDPAYYKTGRYLLFWGLPLIAGLLACADFSYFKWITIVLLYATALVLGHFHVQRSDFE